jgi:phosphohistidine phosphatase
MPGPYELYIVRHAIAEERGAKWKTDAERPLTDEGTERMRKAAKGLVRLGVGLDVVLTSPLVRAKQTADILARAFDEPPPVIVIESLGPGAGYAALLGDLHAHARRTRMALVGHEPDLGRIAARLVGARRPFAFKKGAVCRIDVQSIPPAGSGALQWFVTPSILRAIRKP